MLNILQNAQAVVFIMAFLIFLVVELIKQPIKLLTKKLPQNKRQLANSVILLLPIGFGILGQYLFTNFYSHETFDIVQGVLTGGEAMAMYGIIERVFGLKVNNPYDSKEGALVVETANDIVKDKKFSLVKLFSLFGKLFSKKEEQVQDKVEVIGENKDLTETQENTVNKVETTEDRLKKMLDEIK